MRYLMADEQIGVARKDLRKLAVKIWTVSCRRCSCSQAGDVAMMTADGDYEASLLLFDHIWRGGKVEVNGDIVVAIPAKDVLLITGSKSRKGIAHVARGRRQAQGGVALRDHRYAVRLSRRALRQVHRQIAATTRSRRGRGPPRGPRESAFAQRVVRSRVRRTAALRNETFMQIFLFDLLPFDRHFDEFKPGRHMTFPLPGSYFDPRDRGALLRAASRRVGGDGPARL